MSGTASEPVAPADRFAGAVAAVDCGTNSTRLLVVGADGRHEARLMRITRLGKGVDAARRLDPAAVARTLDVLGEYRRVMDDHRVGAVRMAATSAVRDADNGDDFLAAAEAAVGAPAELLTGEEEGRLAFRGATKDLAHPAGADVVVVDIGGGSTELVVGTPEPGPRVDAVSLGAVSLDVGCVRLTERFLRHDPPLEREIDAAVAFVRDALEHARRRVPRLGSPAPGRVLLGLAGTVSTLSMLEQGLCDYDWGLVHRSVLRLDAVRRWCDVLASEPAAERARRPGMVEGREDVIVGGALVLREVMERFGFEHCTVSETDILDGLAESARGGGSLGGR